MEDALPDLIKCMGGPSKNRKVSSKLGPRWPDVLMYDYKTREVIIGYYILTKNIKPSGGFWYSYKWLPNTIEYLTLS